MKDNEKFICGNFRTLISYSGGCACGSMYACGVWIETHCHKSSCEDGCNYGGFHIGKDWDCNLDIKKIAETIVKELGESWRTDFEIVYLPDGRPDFKY